jgi:ATP-dependent Clp protease ATP-binding subunit ClpC
MFERFSSASRRIVVEAEAEAKALGHKHIGTEHLVLGLLGPAGDGSRASDLLTGCGIDPDEMRLAVRAVVGPGASAPILGSVPFTARAKKVLEISLRETLAGGSDAIEPEHLLLGILREGDGVGARLLIERGVTMELARGQLGVRPSRVRRFRSQGVRPELIPRLSPGALRALACARGKAGGARAEVGTHHLILGVLDEADGLGARVLSQLGVSTVAVEAAAAELGIEGTSDGPVRRAEVKVGEDVLVRFEDPELADRLRELGGGDEVAEFLRQALLDHLAALEAPAEAVE